MTVAGAPRWRAPQRGADERMVPIVPGGFDEHAPEMGVAGFGDRALRALGAAGVFGRDEADEGHGTRRSGKAAGVAELRGDGERGEIIDAAEAAQPLDARARAARGPAAPRRSCSTARSRAAASSTARR